MKNLRLEHVWPLRILVIFYLAAGINHFINSEFYMPLIPDYFSEWKNEINIISGISEIFLALLFIFQKTRFYASIGITVMLILFIPSHIHFITEGLDYIGPFKINTSLAWIRLVIIHPLLILWALKSGKCTDRFL